jgi:hypothetical protein
MGALRSDVPQGDVCFGSPPDSLGRGTNLKNIAPEQFCHLKKYLIFSLLASIDD